MDGGGGGQIHWDTGHPKHYWAMLSSSKLEPWLWHHNINMEGEHRKEKQITVNIVFIWDRFKNLVSTHPYHISEMMFAHWVLVMSGIYYSKQRLGKMTAMLCLFRFSFESLYKGLYIKLTSLFLWNNFLASSRMYCFSVSVSAGAVACHCRAIRKIRRYSDKTSLLYIGCAGVLFCNRWK